MKIKLEVDGANRTVVHIDGADLYFSYETCVAFKDRHGSIMRRESDYSVTTAKHMTQWQVRSWPKVPDEVFERAVASIGA